MESSPLPESAELRTFLMGLEEGQRKVIAGLVVLMMKEPEKVRDREWLMEAYTHVSAQAHEMGDARLDELQVILKRDRDLILNTSFQVFLSVARDAADAGGTPTLAQASVMAMAYFTDGPSPSFEPTDEKP